MFIELTEYDTGQKVLVNLNLIIEIHDDKDGDGAYLISSLTTIENLCVKEPYKKVKRLIADEVAAERGY